MTVSALRDAATMLRRSLRRMRRYPSLTLFVAGIPVVLMLLFVYVFGGTLGAGLGGPGLSGADGDRTAYIAYVVPGILLIAVAGAGQGTAISVAMDMTQGIIARFRTMSIARSAVLAGHVAGAVVQTAMATAVVVAVALVIGFRPTTGPVAWLGATGLLVLAAVAVSCLSAALGLAANSVETASNSPMFLTLLPFLSSGFVPAASMPGPLAWFAERQPFTPIIETLRGLLLGTPIGGSGAASVVWCVVIAGAGFVLGTAPVRTAAGAGWGLGSGRPSEAGIEARSARHRLGERLSERLPQSGALAASEPWTTRDTPCGAYARTLAGRMRRCGRGTCQDHRVQQPQLLDLPSGRLDVQLLGARWWRLRRRHGPDSGGSAHPRVVGYLQAVAHARSTSQREPGRQV